MTRTRIHNTESFLAQKLHSDFIFAWAVLQFPRRARIPGPVWGGSAIRATRYAPLPPGRRLPAPGEAVASRALPQAQAGRLRVLQAGRRVTFGSHEYITWPVLLLKSLRMLAFCQGGFVSHYFICTTVCTLKLQNAHKKSNLNCRCNKLMGRCTNFSPRQIRIFCKFSETWNLSDFFIILL